MDLQEARRGLISKRIDEGDADVAIAMAALIETVDKLAFDTKKCEIAISTHTHPLGNVNFAYHKPSGSEPERYVVYAPGIADRLEAHYKARLLFMPVLGKRVLNMEDLFSAGACHEVRHRLQYVHSRTMRFFKNQPQHHPDKILNMVLRYAYLSMRYHRKDLYDKRAKRYVIEFYTGDNEFDGQVVELFFLAKGKGEYSKEVMLELARESVFIRPQS